MQFNGRTEKKKKGRLISYYNYYYYINYNNNANNGFLVDKKYIVRATASAISV